MQYRQAVAKLNTFVRLAGVKPGLERITALLKNLINPEHEIPVIHIAGTNGKGSVTTMCTNALLECNYKIGTYLSPHLLRYNERILFQGKEISNTDFARIFHKVFLASKKVPGITEFEILTAMAFVYFKECAVDVAVMETGLGGRYDATNVCRSILSIITPIAFDHEKVLGFSLDKIAWEKAGIIKKGVPVVIADQQPSVLKVLLQTAEDLEADLQVVCHPIKFKIDMLGDYQRYNAALTMEALGKLKKYKIYIPRRLMLNGIARTLMPGRTQLVSEKPLTMLDVAHNPHAFQNLLKILMEQYPYKKKVFVLGILKRKNLLEVLRLLQNTASQIYAVDLPTKDAFAARYIVSLGKLIGLKNIEACSSVKTGYAAAKKYAKNNEAIIAVAGSFHTVGGFLKK